MIFSDFIEELKKKDIIVTYSSGKLQYSGPEENITQDLIEELKTYKGKLIKHFWPKELGNLMPINPEGSKIPLFVIHGDNSNYIISEYFGPDQPVYGFFHLGSDGEKIPFTNAKVMAKAYLDKILTVCPSGPYYLIGYSFGGILAFEIAVQLQKSGNKVPFLVLIDTISPLGREPFKWQSNLFQTIRLNILRPIRRKLTREMDLFICNFYILINKPVPIEKRSYYLWIKYFNLTSKYTPDRFEGDILLIRTTKNPSSHKFLGWETLVNNIRMVEIDGKHLEIFVGKDRSDILITEIEKYLKYVNGSN